MVFANLAAILAHEARGAGQQSSRRCGVWLATLVARSRLAFFGPALYRHRTACVESVGWLLLGLSSALTLLHLEGAAWRGQPTL